LPDHPSIFALLDVIDWPEQKQAGKANKQVPVVVANVLSYVANKPVIVDYKGMPEFMIVTNGKVRSTFFS
jgi:apoptosis-inducing factor 2